MYHVPRTTFPFIYLRSILSICPFEIWLCRKECLCMLFLTPYNDFAGGEQVRVLSYLRFTLCLICSDFLTDNLYLFFLFRNFFFDGQRNFQILNFFQLWVFVYLKFDLFCFRNLPPFTSLARFFVSPFSPKILTGRETLQFYFWFWPELPHLFCKLKPNQIVFVVYLLPPHL